MPTPEIHNPFDHASRLLLKGAGVPLLAWLLRVAPSELHFVRWLDTRLSVPNFPERYCDTIAYIRRQDCGGVPHAVPAEFQAAPDPLMWGRALVYGGLLWLLEKPDENRADRFLITPLVVNLTGIGRCARRMTWKVTRPRPGTAEQTPAPAGHQAGEVPGEDEVEVTFAPIEWNLAELDAFIILDQIEAGEAPLALLAWISLMKNGGREDILRRWLALAQREADPRRRADLALVVTYAELTDRAELWRTNLEGFDVQESVILNEYIAKGRTEGRTQGRAEGRIEGLLEAKFGDAGLALMDQVRQVKDAARLALILQAARTAATLDAFRAAAGL